MGGEIEQGFFDAHAGAPLAEVIAQPGKLLFADRIEAHLIEELQQPGLIRRELIVPEEFVPDRQRAAHQLITAGRVHAVDAHIHAADAYRAFGGEGACGAVFGAEQAMARIDGYRTGRAQIDVAQAEDEVAGVKNRIAHRLAALQPVDALDKIDVVGQPGRAGAHRLLIALHGAERGAVFERHRHPDNARRHFQLADVAEPGFQLQQQIHQLLLAEDQAVIAHLQRAHAGR